MNFKLLFLTIFLTLSDPSFAHKEKKVISMCWHEAKPHASKDLLNGGLVYEFVETVMKKAGYKPKLSIIPWQRCLNGVDTGKYDMLFAMWNGVPRFKKKYHFFPATTIETSAVFVLKQSPHTELNFKTDKEFRLGIHIGAGVNRKLTSNKKFEIVELIDDETKMNMTLEKRIDGFIAEKLRVDYILNKRKWAKDTFKILAPVINRHRSSPSIPKSNPKAQELIKRYSIAYQELCKDGTLQRIIKKHGFDFKPIDCLFNQ